MARGRPARDTTTETQKAAKILDCWKKRNKTNLKPLAEELMGSDTPLARRSRQKRRPSLDG